MNDYEKYNWNLEDILKGKTIDELFEEWKDNEKKLIEIYNQGNCYLDINNLKKFLKQSEKTTIISNRLFNYVFNKLNEDLSNQQLQNWSQKISLEASKFGVNFANQKNIILKNEKLISGFIKNDKEINKYKRSFDLIFKEKKHKISEKEEILLTKLSPALDSNNSIFDILSCSEIELLDAKDKNNKTIKFNSISDIMFILQKSNDRILRKNAYKSLNQSFIKFENTLTKTLYQQFLVFNETAKIYNFKNYIDKVCFDDEVETKFIDHVYSQVETYKFAYRKFSEIESKYRKKVLKINKLEQWDKSYDIYSNKNENLTIEDTKEIVLEALSIMGNEYITIVKKAFDENWISWLPKKGKQTGAYSIGGTKGLDKYYILMNFDKTYSSVTTIAHELGHSLNSYYNNKAQDIYSDVKIFYAEIASITNEILLNYYLLNKNKDNKKAMLKIYHDMITNFFGCTTRQIMFSETEKTIIDYIDQNKPVSPQELKEIYSKTFIKYCDTKPEKAKELLEKNNGEALSIIFRLSHFYTGIFYVYKYSIGLVVGILCANKIFSKDKDFTKKYFDFLSSGTSLSPLDTINILGIDLTKSEPWQEALKIVENWINNFKKISN